MSAYQPSKRDRPIARPHSLSDGLTTREQGIMICVCRGMTNQQIARELNISPHTVHAHLRSAFNKLDVPTRTAAAAKFRDNYPDAFHDRTESGALHQPISTTKHRREP